MPLSGPPPRFEAGKPVSAGALQRVADATPFQAIGARGIHVHRNASGFTMRPTGVEPRLAPVKAIVTSFTAMAGQTNRWRYFCRNAVWDLAAHKAIQPSPAQLALRAFAYNAYEENNTATHFGPGYPLSNSSGSFQVFPIPVGTSVWLLRVATDAFGTAEWEFVFPNRVDFECNS